MAAYPTYSYHELEKVIEVVDPEMLQKIFETIVNEKQLYDPWHLNQILLLLSRQRRHLLQMSGSHTTK